MLQEAGRQRILLEVNVGGNRAKAGFRLDELEQAVPSLDGAKLIWTLKGS